MHGDKTMAGNTENGGRRRSSLWRTVPWIIAAFLLLLPFVAMQFTDEVVWDETDFAVIAAMLFGVCGAFELAARMTANTAYRAAVGIALVAAFLLIWINLAVGIIGSEDNLANLMYGGVLAVAMIGALIARFQPDGMARAMVATVLAQASVALIALIAELGYPASPPLEILGVTAMFAALWLLSAWLFRKAARGQAPAGAAA
jgi:hypothetical protein